MLSSQGRDLSSVEAVVYCAVVFSFCDRYIFMFSCIIIFHGIMLLYYGLFALSIDTVIV